VSVGIVAHATARQVKRARQARRERARFNTMTRKMALEALRAYFADEEARTERILALLEELRAEGIHNAQVIC
jgi:hypothetical protein